VSCSSIVITLQSTTCTPSVQTSVHSVSNNLGQHNRQYSTYFPVELFYLQVVSCFNATSSVIGRPNSNDLHGQNTNRTRANYISVQIINYILLPRLNGNIMV